MADRVNLDPKNGLPVGRIVMGSLYKPNTTDVDGRPLVYKNGPNAGQPRSNYFFALAIKKGAERHWAETQWGAIIWGVGHKAFPQAAQSATFAWKVEDGDSQAPNKNGRKPCDNEGWAGHWVLKFSGSYAPKIYRVENGGFVQVTDENYIKPGYFVEVAGTVDGNGSQQQPGIFLNHSAVCFRAFGEEIAFGMDVKEAGFGAAALPAGASAMPAPAAIPMPGAAAPTPPAPGAPVLPAVPGVTPYPAFLSGPGAAYPVPAIPAIPHPSVPTASPSKVLTAKGAACGTYEQFIAQGWTDANLIANGYLQA